MSDLIPFDIDGSGCRFGKDDGTPWVVASDFARIMGYAKTQNAMDALDGMERGHATVVTPGGPQRVGVIYEDGIWELIFRSTLPGAKAIKTRVKAILREIRETGRYDAGKPMTELEMAERYVKALKRNAELEPKAEAFDSFMSAEGDYLIGNVAQMLGMGQNTLFARLRDEHVLIAGGRRHNTPYQQYLKHFRVTTRTYEDSTGAQQATYTTYVKPSGVDWIRKLLKMTEVQS